MKRRVQSRPKQHWPAFLNESPSDFYFEATRSEQQAEQRIRNDAYHRSHLLARLEEVRLQMLKDDERLRKLLLADMTAALEADRRRIAEILQLEETRLKRMEEIERVKAWYEAEHKREEEREDKARRKKAADLAKMIARDTSKRERQKFEARGLVKGRRKQ